MLIYQAAGFSMPLADAPPVMGEGVRFTSAGIRTGPANNDGHEWIRPLAIDALNHGDVAIFIVAGWEWRDDSKPEHSPGHLIQDRKRPIDFAHTANQAQQIIHDWRFAGGKDRNLTIEIGNELDLTDVWRRGKLGKFPALVMQVYNAVRELSDEVKIVTGSVSNFRKRPNFWRSRRGFEVLECLRDAHFPRDTLQGLHPYRNDLPPGLYHDWHRDEALDVLRGLLDGRKVAITEMGWYSGGNWTDDQIAGFVHDEIAAWRDFGADSFVFYQLQDGVRPDNSGEGGFGAFTNHVDGFEPKPVSNVLADERVKGDV